jgi:purine-cytosine permease-like protein
MGVIRVIDFGGGLDSILKSQIPKIAVAIRDMFFLVRFEDRFGSKNIDKILEILCIGSWDAAALVSAPSQGTVGSPLT